MRALVVVALVAACATPQHDSGDYGGAARKTAEATASAVATALLGVAQQERASGAYLTVLVESAERDAVTEQGRFDALTPPRPSDDRVRDELDPLLADATSGLAELRIACHRGDAAELTRTADDLRPTLRALRDLAERLPS